MYKAHPEPFPLPPEQTSGCWIAGILFSRRTRILFFFFPSSLRKQEVTWHGGVKGFVFLVHGEICWAAQAEMSAHGVMVAKSGGSIQRQVSYSPFGKQGEKLPCPGRTSLEALGVCQGTVGDRCLLHPMLVVLPCRDRVIILKAVSPPLPIQQPGCSHTRSAARGTVRYSCALCRCDLANSPEVSHLHPSEAGKIHWWPSKIFSQHRDVCGWKTSRARGEVSMFSSLRVWSGSIENIPRLCAPSQPCWSVLCHFCSPFSLPSKMQRCGWSLIPTF